MGSRGVMRTLAGSVGALALLWATASLASSVWVESDRDVVLAAKWVFVGEVTSYELWSEGCNAGVHMKLRSRELLHGSAREFVDLPYELWWPSPMGDKCPSVSYSTPPEASSLEKGAVVIATVVGPNYASDDAAYATFDVSRRAEIEGWLKKQQPAAPPKEGQSP